MKMLFILTFIANLALGAWSLTVLPDEVATHFGVGGEADAFGSRETSTCIFMALDTGMFCLFLFIPWLIGRIPSGFINIPNREYWLDEENMPDTRVMLSALMYEFGAALMVFMFAAKWLTIKANMSEPVKLDNLAFFTALGLFMAYTVYWCVKMINRFRMPGNRPVPPAAP